eukprot:PhM_4_TR1000/c0_g1_i1/m.79622/K08073/PNKP; bifunctional polynucleotide phosphatase/kinase
MFRPGKKSLFAAPPSSTAAGAAQSLLQQQHPHDVEGFGNSLVPDTPPIPKSAGAPIPATPQQQGIAASSPLRHDNRVLPPPPSLKSPTTNTAKKRDRVVAVMDAVEEDHSRRNYDDVALAQQVQGHQRPLHDDYNHSTTQDEKEIGNRRREVMFKLQTQRLTEKIKDSQQKARPLCVVLVGPPGSGKSTLFRSVFYNESFVHVNRDTLGTHERCLSMAKDSVRKRLSFVVDNTNPSSARRGEFIRCCCCCDGEKYDVICVLLSTPIDVCKARNSTRGPQAVPDSAYVQFENQFENISLLEGFSEIIVV